MIPSSSLIIWNTDMCEGFEKVISPLGGPVSPGLGGGLDGGRSGARRSFMVCKHIWIPQGSLSIASTHTRGGKHEILTPHPVLSGAKLES